MRTKIPKCHISLITPIAMHALFVGNCGVFVFQNKSAYWAIIMKPWNKISVICKNCLVILCKIKLLYYFAIWSERASIYKVGDILNPSHPTLYLLFRIEVWYFWVWHNHVISKHTYNRQVNRNVSFSPSNYYWAWDLKPNFS